MKRIQGFALGSILCLALAGMVMASEAEVYTVGDFATSLAKMVTNRTDYTPEEARAYLQKLGVNLTGDLESGVDEAAFVDAFSKLGLSMTTETPDQAVSGANADRVFRMFDRSDSLFSGEAFKLCKGGALNQNTPCVNDADCMGGFCQTLTSIKCKGGPNDGGICMTDADCNGGTCDIPPGQAKKLGIASPSD